MKFLTLQNHNNPWEQSSAAHGDVLMGTMGRITRSLPHELFPGWSTQESRERVADTLRPALLSTAGLKTAFSAKLSELTRWQRRLLFEKRLLSPSMAAKQDGSEIIIPKRQHMSIMINEEEHLAIHCFNTGSKLEETHNQLNEIMGQIAQKINFAQDSQGNYLSSSVGEKGDCQQYYLIMHLPGMVLTDMLSSVNRALEKLSMGISPYYGKQKMDIGNTFSIFSLPASPDKTLINLLRLRQVAEMLVKRESQIRKKLLRERPVELRDQVGRSIGLLRYASQLSFSEMADALSFLRLGTNMKLVNWLGHEGSKAEIIKLLIGLYTQLAPAHLEIQAKELGCSLSSPACRAQLIHAILDEKNPVLCEPSKI